jgi:enoyl-CoA hydratase/carnithine racemase
MSFDQILYDVADGIAVVTLNRPDVLNAWTHTMALEVRAALQQARDDKNVRVIILTGAGRGFCAGVDMKSLSGMSQDDGQRPAPLPVFDASARPDFQKRLSYLPAVPKPIIAAINGPCAGLGLALSLYCDLRFAAEEARFTTAFSRRGLIAEFGIGWMLPAIIGMPAAMDLLLSARKFDAAEALQHRTGSQQARTPAAILRLAPTRGAPRHLAAVVRQHYGDRRGHTLQSGRAGFPRRSPSIRARQPPRRPARESPPWRTSDAR